MTHDDDWLNTGENSDFAGMEEADDPDIQAILDIGYDQLDEFVVWLEETLGLDTRTAQQDCFNAEMLIDYLANQQRKTASEINEFDLRWFLFSHYLRKAMADAETEERLPDSLQRFFAYLEAEQGYVAPDWLRGVLDERAYYLARRAAYAALDGEDEREWEAGYRAWCAELEDDLDARCLWPPRELADGFVWGDTMGWREATLQDEANRFWQQERAELMELGMDCESMRGRLLDAYYQWLDTPQARLDDQTPREVILTEREARQEMEEETDEEES